MPKKEENKEFFEYKELSEMINQLGQCPECKDQLMDGLCVNGHVFVPETYSDGREGV